MVGAGIELVDASQRVYDSPFNNGESRLSVYVQTLLKEAQALVNQISPRATETLPPVTLSDDRAARLRATDSSNPNLAMGNPSRATTNPANGNNYLHVRDQYVMSYNKDHKTPNWVSWQLDEDWLGSVRRTGNFLPDEALPSGFERALPSDYTRSGYDRGHNTPSGDRTATRPDNEATFYMSNMAPQAPDNNQGPWEKLESYSRELAREGKELYIIAGNSGSKGEIGNGVNVPESWWKVIAVLPRKGMGAADVSSNTEVIAVQMPNVNGIKNDDWRKYITTVDAIEQQTGYDFLSNVPPNIQQVIEAKRYGK